MSIKEQQVSADMERTGAGTRNQAVGSLENVMRRESDAVLHSLYNEQDVQKWQQGAGKYQQFITTIPPEKRQYLQEEDLGELQALFLEEKPAIFGVRSVERYLESELRRFGLESVGDYTYNPSAVREVLRSFAADFEGLPTGNPQVFMAFLAVQDKKTHALQRGLILGFPRASAKQYEWAEALEINKLALALLDIFGEGTEDWDLLAHSFYGNRTNKKAIESFFEKKLVEHKDGLGIVADDLPRLMDELRYVLSARAVSIHGIVWVEREDSNESLEKQQRLHTAFERSGILS